MLLAGAAQGCGPAPQSATHTATLEDGLRVVASTGSAGAVSGWRLREVFHVGWRDDEPTFEYVATAKLREDGSVVVADANAGQVWVLGPEGTVVATVGREGQGPGEYEWLDAAVPGRGDTIFVQSDAGRLATFVGDTHVDTRRVEWGFRWDERLLMEVAAVRPDGDLLFVPGSRSPRHLGRWVDAPVLRSSRELASIDTVLRFDGYFDAPRGDRNPLRRLGGAWPTAHGFVVARNDTPEVRWYDDDGVATQIARWDHEPNPLSDDAFDDYARRTLERGSLEATPERLARMTDEQRGAIGEPLPIWRRILAAPSGTVWLTDYGDHPLDFGGRAFLLAPDGRWLGSVAVPDGVILMDVNDEYALGVVRSDYDVQAVVKWRIERPDGG